MMKKDVYHIIKAIKQAEIRKSNPTDEKWIYKSYLLSDKKMLFSSFKALYLKVYNNLNWKTSKKRSISKTSIKKVTKKKEPKDLKKDTKKKETKDLKKVTKTKTTSKKIKPLSAKELAKIEKKKRDPNYKKEIDDYEIKLAFLKLDIDLPLRRAIYDFSLEHFFSGDIKKPRDFEKIKKIYFEKFKRPAEDEKIFRKIYYHAYKAYNAYIKGQAKPKLLSNEELKQLERTIVLPKQSNRGQIKDSMQYVLDNIRSIQRTKLLTKEQEQFYARMVTEGKTKEEKMKGRKKLIDSNLRLVISTAKKYSRKGIPIEDLIDEGVIGLNKAIDKFEPNKGFKFGTYATWWVRQAITRAISDNGRIVRIPVHIIEQIGKASKEERNLSLRKGREPDQKTLSDKVREKHKINLSKLNELKRTSSDPIFFDKAIADHNESKFVDFLADETLQSPDEYVKEKIQNKLIEESFETLNEEEKQVIFRYFGFHGYRKTQKFSDIAKAIGKKPDQVKEIYSTSLKKIEKSEFGRSLRMKLDNN